MRALQPVVGYCTEVGRMRRCNDDAAAGPPEDLDAEKLERLGFLYAVADGVGDDRRGQVASQLAADTVVDEYYYGQTAPSPADRLVAAVEAANRKLVSERLASPSEVGFTSLTAAVVRANELLVAHVGDSRAYLIRGDAMRQVTRDHVAEECDPAQSALSTGDGASLTARASERCLGALPDVSIDRHSERLQSGDRVLLCTRGLTDVVDDDQILLRVRKLGPRRAPEALVDLATERGGLDAATALIITVGGAAISGPVAAPLRKRATRRKRAPIPVTMIAALALAAVLLAVGPSLVPKIRPVVASAALGAVSSWQGLRERLQATTALQTPPAVMTEQALLAEAAIAPRGTATALVRLADEHRATAAAESTRILSTAAVEATSGAMGRLTATAFADQARGTATALFGDLRRATLEAASASAGARLLLTQPVKGASASGEVLFDWAWPRGLRPGQVYEVRACKDAGCQPSMKGRTLDSPWRWCPDQGTGFYRWQVHIVDSKSLAGVGVASGVEQFTWTGGAPCASFESGPADEAGDSGEDEPARPTKEKAPPPVRSTVP